MSRLLLKILLAATSAYATTAPAAPILAPSEPYQLLATYQVTDNTYPHFGLTVQSSGNFPTVPSLPFTANLDPHTGYPDLTIWGPWIFTFTVGFSLVPHTFSPDEQLVRISGMVQHRDGGQVFNYDLLSTPTSEASLCKNAGPFSHKDGYDTFQACLNSQRQSSDDGARLYSWNASINAWHNPVPEPGQLSLLLAALTAMVFTRRLFRRPL